MKSILMSIKPQFVAKILNGEKTIEIRKKFPKDYVGWVYIYCTQGVHLFKSHITAVGYSTICQIFDDVNYEGNGKVVARFWCNKVEEICLNEEQMIVSETMYEEQLLKASCLTVEEMDKYLEPNEFEGYAIHISKLEIFDEPKELWEFKRPKWCKCGVKDENGLYQCNECPYGNNLIITCEYDKLIKAPQSRCYIEINNEI